MDKFISPNQLVFLKEKMLVDGVVTINEVVDLAMRSKRVCLIFKMDFEKTSDLVSSNFLDYMLIKFVFSEMWMYWMRVCVFIDNRVVLVNECPTQEINI